MAEGTEVTLTGSRGVQLKHIQPEAKLSGSLNIVFPAAEPFQTVSMGLIVLAELENKKDASAVEVNISVSNPWTQSSKDIPLHFVPVIYASFNLLTAMSRKFLQISVQSTSARNFILRKGSLEIVNGKQVPGLSLAAVGRQSEEMVICKQFEGCYLWELETGEEEEASEENPAKVSFTVNYSSQDGLDADRLFTAVFQFQDYKTLYTIHAKVEPARGRRSWAVRIHIYIVKQISRFYLLLSVFRASTELVN